MKAFLAGWEGKLGKNRVMKKLIEEITKTLDKGPKTAQRRITAKVKELVIERDIAALLVAHDLGLDISKFASKEQKVEIRNYLISKTRDNTKLVNAKDMSRGVTVKEPKITDPPSASQDAFLVKQDFSAARINAELYPTIYLFENSVRKYISDVMQIDYGPNWWEDVIAKQKPKLDQLVIGRMHSETKFPWHSRRGAAKIFYTDIDDLLNILNTYGTKKEFHKSLDGNLETVRVWIQEIQKTRNISGHNNPVTKTDRNRLGQFAKDWHKFAKSLYTRLGETTRSIAARP